MLNSVTIHDYSSLFATIRSIRTISLYSLFGFTRPLSRVTSQLCLYFNDQFSQKGSDSDQALPLLLARRVSFPH